MKGLLVVAIFLLAYVIAAAWRESNEIEEAAEPATPTKDAYDDT
jgi:hypothetical protein